jgi:hypothetical protein
MLRSLLRPTRVIALGVIGTLVLLGAVSRPGQAEKAVDCLNQTSSLCQTVERCSGGFEANGSCPWIYTISRYYWRY